MKVASSNSNMTTGTCSCKVGNTHTYYVFNSQKHPSIDLKTNDMNMETKLKTVKTTEKQKTVYILDASMVKKINGISSR